MTTAASSSNNSSSVIETDVVAVQENDEGTPSRVNDYAVLEVLGEGSFSKVYRCQTSRGDEYALKILKKSFLKRKREYKKVEGKMVFCNALEKVQREVAIMKKLAHVNLVKLHEIIDSAADDKMFLVLELVQGGQVMHWDDKAFRYRAATSSTGVLDIESARSCLRDVVAALSYLHANHICHRDIKPENILLTTAGVYKLADFGVAHMLDDAHNVTLRSTEGTYHFLAPECTTGDAYDPFQVDIWALGVTLFVLLYGTLPFGTKAASLTQVMDSIRLDPLVFDATDSVVAPECVALIERMLDKDPHTRVSIHELCTHPWFVATGTESPRLGLSQTDTATAAATTPLVVEVSQQEIEAAFTPVNNFILMTKLKLKMSSRLARARKSVEHRRGSLDATSDDDGLACRLAAVANASMGDAAKAESTAPSPPRSAEVAPLPRRLLHTRSSGELIRRRNGFGKSGLDELSSLVYATRLPSTVAASSDSVVETAAAALDLAASPPKSLARDPLTTSPTLSSRLSHRGSTSASSVAAHEPRLPPLMLSLSPTSSPTQSPAASPTNKERGRSGAASIEHRRSSIERAAPATVHSTYDSAVDAAMLPTAAGSASLQQQHSPTNRHTALPHPSAVDATRATGAYGSGSGRTALLLSEPPVMLQSRKSSLSASLSAVETYAQAQRKSSTTQRLCEVATELELLNYSSSSGNSSAPAAVTPFLPSPRSPSRSCGRTDSLALRQAPGNDTSHEPPERMNSIRKALSACLPLSELQANGSDSSSTNSASSTSRPTSAADRSPPKLFEKRLLHASSGDTDAETETHNTLAGRSSPTQHQDLSSTVGTTLPQHNGECEHDWAGPSSFRTTESEVDADVAAAFDKPRRSSLVDTFSNRRSLLEAQDSLQKLLIRGKSAAKLAILARRNSSVVYELKDHHDGSDASTSANTAANTSALTNRSPTRNGSTMSVLSMISALHRASSSHVVAEAPKAPGLLRTQNSVACSIM